MPFCTPDWNFLSDKGGVLSDSIIYHLYDLLDTETIQMIIKEVQPDYIFHLASYSSVTQNWKAPVTSFLNNSNVFLILSRLCVSSRY